MVLNHIFGTIFGSVFYFLELFLVLWSCSLKFENTIQHVQEYQNGRLSVFRCFRMQFSSMKIRTCCIDDRCRHYIIIDLVSSIQSGALFSLLENKVQIGYSLTVHYSALHCITLLVIRDAPFDFQLFIFTQFHFIWVHFLKAENWKQQSSKFHSPKIPRSGK